MTTEAALGIMGEAHELLGALTKSSQDGPERTGAVMATYRELIGVGLTTRAAAVLVGVPRATATRRPRTRALAALSNVQVDTGVIGRYVAEAALWTAGAAQAPPAPTPSHTAVVRRATT